jgi:hypothetical protein
MFSSQSGWICNLTAPSIIIYISVYNLRLRPGLLSLFSRDFVPDYQRCALYCLSDKAKNSHLKRALAS